MCDTIAPGFPQAEWEREAARREAACGVGTNEGEFQMNTT